MATQFNGSSYYRANPYYQQGFIPNSAFKNRKPPYQMGEIPQGEEYFEPTNKKHFQRLGYYSTIADQKIIHSDQSPAPASPAKDKDYFRSLNINDIEGATTNTLISMAVKNRMKAQEELNKRAQLQKESQQYEKMRILAKEESDKKRMEALNILKKNSEPNYHELTKRMRTQEKQKLAAKLQESPENRIASQQIYAPTNKVAYNNPNKAYYAELEQADKEIKQLQLQLSQVKSQKERAQQEYEERYKRPPSNTKQENYKNIAPITNQAEPEYNYISSPYRPQSNQDNPEQNYNYSPKSKLQLSPEEIQYLATERERQQNLAQKYHPEAVESINNQKSMNEKIRTQRRSYNDEFDPSPQVLSGRQHRQNHRRINPTYLSYGSPSIGLAGKNIVGY